MPSQIFHTIFAQELIARLEASASLRGAGGVQDSALAKNSVILLGAQGPDIFFHNRRTKPSGLGIGVLLHKKLYGSFSARLLECCLRRGYSARSTPGLYVLSFMSHAIVDRHFHPFINFFGGWVQEGNEASKRYVHCHAFFERIVDLFFLLRLRARPGAAPPSVQDLRFAEDFADLLYSPELNNILDIFVTSLRGCFRKLAEDEVLEERFLNALRDSAGFYMYSHRPLGAEEHSRRWAALVHPLHLPKTIESRTIDYANATKKQWCDPMDSACVYTDSLADVYARAFKEALAVLTPVYAILNGESPPANYAGLAQELGDHGLRTTIYSEEQTLEHSDPLPLAEIIQAIALKRERGAQSAWSPWYEVLARPLMA